MPGAGRHPERGADVAVVGVALVYGQPDPGDVRREPAHEAVETDGVVSHYPRHVRVVVEGLCKRAGDGLHIRLAHLADVAAVGQRAVLRARRAGLEIGAHGTPPRRLGDSTGPPRRTLESPPPWNTPS